MLLRRLGFYGLLLVICLGGVWVFGRMFILDYYIVTGEENAPQLSPGDVVLGWKLPGRFLGEYERGEMVVFRVDAERFTRTLSIGRVVGLAGDRIEIQDGLVIRNGEPTWYREGDKIFEMSSQVDYEVTSEESFQKDAVTISPRYLFILRDDRQQGRGDSRHFDAIPEDWIQARKVKKAFWN